MKIALLDAWWPVISSVVATVVALLAATHAMLNKRDTRSATGWAAVILMVPFVGALLYYVMGINRISRVATRVRGGMRLYEHASGALVTSSELERQLPAGATHLIEIGRALDRTTRRPLLSGNRVTMLRDGDEAYPEMLRSIASAKRSIALLSYIFDHDDAGQTFVDALTAARARGVDVRVLLDDAGARYSRPTIDSSLQRGGVRVERFLPVWRPWLLEFANLRNHRKILVIDGTIGFTGGINIRQHCLLAQSPRDPTRDLHFRLDGPVVAQLSEVFAEDWTFATGEALSGDAWFPDVAPAGAVFARAISDGPDHDLDCMRWALHAALASARRSVRVVTPYFLPDEPLVTALNIAALRGVTVDIVIPERGNLWIVNWAMRGELWKVLRHGCRVWLTPPPFDHSKAMVVDEAWSLIGSANWDPRSLRLNFELGVECYDPAVAAALGGFVAERIAISRRLDATELAGEPWPIRIRNGAARLLSPYL